MDKVLTVAPTCPQVEMKNREQISESLLTGVKVRGGGGGGWGRRGSSYAPWKGPGPRFGTRIDAAWLLAGRLCRTNG